MRYVSQSRFYGEFITVMLCLVSSSARFFKAPASLPLHLLPLLFRCCSADASRTVHPPGEVSRIPTDPFLNIGF